MITIFKIFENKNEIPNYNNYIIISSKYLDEDHTTIYTDDAKNFIDNNIGVMINKCECLNNIWILHIKYDNIPKNILSKFRKFNYNENYAIATFTVDFNIQSINNEISFDKNKEILKIKLDTNKFNI